MSTENIAYEKRYWDWRAQYDTMFAPENRFPQQDEQFPLVDGYSVRSKAYLALTCWLSPAVSGPAPAPPLCWTFPALSSPTPRRVGWMCGASLTRTIPGSKADGHDTLRTAAGQSREHQGQ